jgi:hypothetical protein
MVLIQAAALGFLGATWWACLIAKELLMWLNEHLKRWKIAGSLFDALSIKNCHTHGSCPVQLIESVMLLSALLHFSLRGRRLACSSSFLTKCSNQFYVFFYKKI